MVHEDLGVVHLYSSGNCTVSGWICIL